MAAVKIAEGPCSITLLFFTLFSPPWFVVPCARTAGSERVSLKREGDNLWPPLFSTLFSFLCRFGSQMTHNETKSRAFWKYKGKYIFFLTNSRISATFGELLIGGTASYEMTLKKQNSGREQFFWWQQESGKRREAWCQISGQPWKERRK